MDKIYVIGHQTPDLDSVAAAITFANYKNKTENTDIYTPAIAGDINLVTKFVLEKLDFEKPEILSDASGKNLILVDHNEEAQQVPGEDNNIIEILDHHKVNFAGVNPIRIDVWPIGSSCSIIYKKYKEAGVEIEKNLAGLMLSAVLDDTVISKSPTCTEEDKVIISELAEIAEINDWKEYGIEMFKAKADVGAMTEAEIVKMDFKDFQMKAGKFGIGQVETVDLSLFEDREEKLLQEMNSLMTSEGYHSVILFMTDILNEGSKFLVATTDQEKVEEALGKKLENNKTYIEGIISRKKQVSPKFSEVFDK